MAAFSYTDQANGVGIPFNYTRGNPLPLDSWSLFMSFNEAQSYARTNPVAYPGQVLTVLDNGDPTVYVIRAGTVTGEGDQATENTSQRELVQLGQQSESGADIYWLQSNGQRYDDSIEEQEETP